MSWGDKPLLLKLKIDDQWEPENFIQIIESVEALYYVACLMGRRSPSRSSYYEFVDRYGRRFSYLERIESLRSNIIEEARHSTRRLERLRINKIQYASPGGIDFAGMGKAMEALEKMFSRLLTFFEDRRLRRHRDDQAELDTERKKVEIEQERETLRSMQIENAKEIIGMLEDYPDEVTRLLTSLLVREQDKIGHLISSGKIVGVSPVIDGEEQARD